MLEILILIGLLSAMGKKMRAKGRTGVGYQFMLFGLWLMFEIIGFVVGLALSDGGRDGLLPACAGAFVGGIVGEVIAFCIANSIPALTQPQYTAKAGLYPVAQNYTQPQA